MIWFLRLSLWFLAIFFAAVPVFLAIAKTPGQVLSVFEAGSYAGLSRDLMFCAIGVLAIGLVDAFDSITICLDSEKPGQVGTIGVSLLISLVIIGQLVIYAAWSAATSNAPAPLEIGTVFVVTIAFACALVARLILVFGTGD